MIRLVYASPPSLSPRMARTIWGTSTVFSTPPASRMYMLFGTVLAMVNISACRVPLPNRNTSSISRKNPITRDSGGAGGHHRAGRDQPGGPAGLRSGGGGGLGRLAFGLGGAPQS